MTYATDPDVVSMLGTIGNRLPSWVTVATFRDLANAELVDRLAAVYPHGIPTFTGTGLEAVRWAEAKLAAAEILDAVRVNLPDLGDAPDRLRASVDRTLDGGIVGYPPGSTDVEGGTPGEIASPTPRVSSYTPLSAFPDPYDAARGVSRFE